VSTSPAGLCVGEGEQDLGGSAVEPAGRFGALGEDGMCLPVEVAAQHREVSGLVQVQADPHIVVADELCRARTRAGG
jgi:hypothetical protein